MSSVPAGCRYVPFASCACDGLHAGRPRDMRLLCWDVYCGVESGAEPHQSLVFPIAAAAIAAEFSGIAKPTLLPNTYLNPKPFSPLSMAAIPPNSSPRDQKPTNDYDSFISDLGTIEILSINHRHRESRNRPRTQCFPPGPLGGLIHPS